ncbi:MAG TPA: anaerobic sulfatase maturase [Acidimicrobiales bacterium]|nr:anaerobic sulfatase maturase [Acidimicrobiales bacterium]
MLPDLDRPPTARAAVHVMAKPTGPICNLDCEYCFFLSKEALYPGDRFRMSDEVMEAYVGQLLDSHPGPEVTIAWQGGEPTLMGIEFFRRALDAAQRLRKPGQVLRHTIQTNGTLLTDEWCELFAENDFLVGISIDGPPELHDTYRVDKRGNPTSAKVSRGLELLRAHGVEFNVLCTVNAANQDHGLEVYRYFRDELGARFIQFIPIVERDNDTGFQEGDQVTDRSVAPEAFGRFLTSVFDEWVVRDIGTVFVQAFDAALASWLHLPASVCVFAETCGKAVALEHNGDLYSCDHFVEPKHLLGNITETPLVTLVTSQKQFDFGNAKRDTLPRYCVECNVRFACNGECPKNRFVLTPDGEQGLNYLCAGFKAFFTHIDPLMRLMARRVGSGGYADEVMTLLSRAPRNTPCPCGSGRKAKHCHQRIDVDV